MKNKIIMIAIQVVVLIIAVGATWWFTTGNKPDAPAEGAAEAAVEQPQKAPEYISLTPSFVVNLQGSRPMRFLMVEVDLMTRNDDNKDLIEQYLPTLRHELNMLFSAQTQESIETVEARALLQQQALDKVNEVLERESKRRPVDGLYFTKFVMQ